MKRLLSYTLIFIFLSILFTSSSYAQQRGLTIVKIKDKEGKDIGLYRESHALLIGVSDYTAGWPKLPGVKRDITEVKSILERHGFSVTVVLDPNHETLIKAFTDFINRYGLKPDNRLLFYFAGHGHTIKQAYGEEMGYIIPTDAPNPNKDKDGFLSKAMDMQQIEVFAKRIQSKHALFLFDSCFSGSIFALSRAVPESITYKTDRPVRQFITSGSAEETVPDKSIFREQFISALKGEADLNKDGYVTGTELGEFLQDKVINYSRAAQHPQYGKIRNPNLDKGDFVFQVASISPRP
ncbi:MAG: caspase family protein, partial [Syntrophorhabdaceae bacterium]|nr:caspase family protein [Syntrophorhabdaceae bacterium]